MSTYSKNLFDILGDGETPRPLPVKEEAAPVVIDKKNVSKINKDAARSARIEKGDKAKRPQRGRQFDRHSGTGIVDSQKKINKGWGKAGSAEEQGAKDTLSPADPAAAEQEVAVVEEEEVVKTLDEYLAEKANKALKVSLPEARKANDNDEAAFKGAVAFEKKDFEEFYVKETKVTKKTEKVRKEKVYVNIEQRFQEKTREFKKTDRRGPAGNKKNARRSNKKDSAAPSINLQDASAFPTLGATA